MEKLAVRFSVRNAAIKWSGNKVKAEEGYIRLNNGYRIWFRRVGNGRRSPLLVLHGGPGAGHDYLEPLEQLALERPVIFYDQLGCGKSDQPADPSLWEMRRFVDELTEVRQALNLYAVHLFGQSSGGMLAIDYMLRNPAGVKSLILADSCASMPQLQGEVNRLRAELPPEMVADLARCQAEGYWGNPECRAAVIEFYKRHVCRLPDKPECLMRTMENMKKNSSVYECMNGPNELVISGNMKDWDRTAQLSRIFVPTLILCGRYDELTPACSDVLHKGIAGSQMVVFEDSSHLPHIEEGEKFFAVVADFLARADEATAD